jgi:hypothetical protein
VVLWLVCCVVIVNGLVVCCVALATQWTVRTKRRVAAESASSPVVLPDFAVIDLRYAIHFVPLPEDGHDLGSARCPCHPSKTVNRRRSGRRVVYLDHRQLDPRR